MKKTVLVPVANGFEEIEAMTIIDVLRRAGCDVTIASVQKKEVTASHGVKIIADCIISDCEDNEYDLIALPGGIPGSTNLKNSKTLEKMLNQQKQKNKKYAAICAAPAVVLQAFGLLENKKATCYPSFTDELSSYSNEATVITDGICITSQGAGTAMDFAFALVESLFDSDKANELKASMLVRY